MRPSNSQRLASLSDLDTPAHLAAADSLFSSLFWSLGVVHVAEFDRFRDRLDEDFFRARRRRSMLRSVLEVSSSGQSCSSSQRPSFAQKATGSVCLRRPSRDGDDDYIRPKAPFLEKKPKTILQSGVPKVDSGVPQTWGDHPARRNTGRSTASLEGDRPTVKQER